MPIIERMARPASESPSPPELRRKASTIVDKCAILRGQNVKQSIISIRQ
jgi:hypothetical protein